MEIIWAPAPLADLSWLLAIKNDVNDAARLESVGK